MTGFLAWWLFGEIVVAIRRAIKPKTVNLGMLADQFAADIIMGSDPADFYDPANTETLRAACRFIVLTLYIVFPIFWPLAFLKKHR